MQKKQNILEILEKQIDKIVLGLMVIISLGILWLYVLSGPYAESVDGKKRGPGEIDRYVRQRAEQLEEKLNEPASLERYNPVHVSAYEELMRCPLKDIEEIVLLPVPQPGSEEIEEDRIYDIPEIGPLTEVAVAALRGAVQKPVEDVGPDNPYLATSTELADIDLVTVSASFDLQRLYNNFQQSFNAPGLRLSWRSAEYAAPVFAAMELQRRELREDGSWSDWQIVPRTRIDMYRERMQSLPRTLEDSQFGISVWIPKFKDQRVQLDILQPDVYQYSVSRCAWMPPVQLQEAMDYLNEQKKQRQRDLREQRATETAQPEMLGRDTRRTTRDTSRRQTDRRANRPGGRTLDPVLEDPAARRTARTREERDLQDIQKDVQALRLDEKTDLSKIRGLTTVWAHDDTTVPGSTYQYRMRLGVFNPIAGKDWLRSDEAHYKNQIVLWSPYSGPTDEIFIPEMIHVFPTEVIEAANGSDQPEGVELEVAKYYHGMWRIHTFEVYPGQLIGYELEDVPQEDQRTPRTRTDEMMGVGIGMGIQPQTERVDFSTNMMMVDISREVSWGSSLRPAGLYQMIYFDESERLLRSPVNKKNWTKAIRSDYDAVQDALTDEVQGQTPDMRMPGGLDLLPPRPGMEDRLLLPPGGGA